jgi:hypothetical protein
MKKGHAFLEIRVPINMAGRKTEIIIFCWFTAGGQRNSGYDFTACSMLLL